MKVLSQLARWFDEKGVIADADAERLTALGLLSHSGQEARCGCGGGRRCRDCVNRDDSEYWDDGSDDRYEVAPQEAGAADPTDAASGVIAHVRPKQLGRRDGPQRSIRRGMRQTRAKRAASRRGKP